MPGLNYLIGAGGGLLLLTIGIIIKRQHEEIGERQEKVVCDERYRVLVKIENKLDELIKKQAKMATDIAILSNGRKRVTDQ